MDFDLNEIKHIRKKLGLTQQELAKRAGVSQSLIAKVESKRIDPTYSHVQRISNALEQLSHTKEQKAIEIMQKKIVFAKPGDSIQSVIEKMKKYSISQMPVLQGMTAVGTISETALLYGLLHHKGSMVKDVMEEAPPIVASQTGLSVLSNLLRFSSMILVAEKGKVVGLITKADVLGRLKSI